MGHLNFEALGGHNLVVRVVSALVLLPFVLGAVWYGDWIFRLLLGAAAVLMYAEWLRLAGVPQGLSRVLLAAVLAAALALVTSGGADHVGAVAIGLGSSALLLSIAGLVIRHSAIAWAGLGLVYIALPILALDYLRARPDGALWVLWTLVVVWGTDIGGYFVGKSIGGPKLAPKLSPKKTWSGLVGGAILATIAGYGVVLWGELEPHLLLGMSAPLLAVWSQAGDITESAMKRYRGVKDAGGLIPGHGGLLDRVDGLIFVAPVVALLVGAVLE